MSDPRVEIAGKVREAMIQCLEERDGRYYATEAGCERLREILTKHGISALVSVGEDGRFEVRPELRGRNHTCHWPGCPEVVSPRMWGCKEHWFRLPKRLRDEIWDSYRPGQEVTKTPSARYIEAAQEVQKWIASQ